MKWKIKAGTQIIRRCTDKFGTYLDHSYVLDKDWITTVCPYAYGTDDQTSYSMWDGDETYPIFIVQRNNVWRVDEEGGYWSIDDWRTRTVIRKS